MINLTNTNLERPSIQTPALFSWVFEEEWDLKSQLAMVSNGFIYLERSLHDVVLALTWGLGDPLAPAVGFGVNLNVPPLSPRRMMKISASSRDSVRRNDVNLSPLTSEATSFLVGFSEYQYQQIQQKDLRIVP